MLLNYFFIYILKLLKKRNNYNLIMADFMQRSLLKQKNLTHSIMDVHDTMSESSEQNKKYIEEQL